MACIPLPEAGAAGLNADSRILCVSTGGDADRDNDRRIVRDGLHPAP